MNIRTKEEIFKSDYVTLAEMSLFGSLDNMYEEMRELIKREEKEEREKIHSRFEILDIR